MAQVSGCCTNNNQSWRTDNTLYTQLEAVVRTAVGVTAAAMAPGYFLPALAVGCALSLAKRAWSQMNGEAVVCGQKNKPVCAQGYSELLSGRRFADEINLAITGLFIAAHTCHMPHFFAPFSGIFLGSWVGDQISDALGWP